MFNGRKLNVNRFEKGQLTRQPGGSYLPCPLPEAENCSVKFYTSLAHFVDTEKCAGNIFPPSPHFFANFSTNILQKFAQISPLSQTRIVSKNNFYEPVLVYLHPPLTLRLCPLYIRVSRHKLIKRRGLIYRDPIVVIDHIWSRVFVVCCK